MSKISSGSLTVVDVKGGSDGINTATIYLYQRAKNAPEKPQSNITYTFNTATVSGGLGSWQTDLSQLTGTNPIWVIAAVAHSNGVSDVIDPNEWVGPTKLAQDGIDGEPGEPGAPGAPGLNQATVFIYKRASNVTKPSNSTYTFATGNFTVDGNWEKTIPTATTENRNPCWVCSAVAIGSGNTAELVWSNPSLLVENGSDGLSPIVTQLTNGVKIVDAEGNETFITNGSDGQSYYTHVRYSENANGSNYVTTPTLDTIYVGIYSGLSSTAPSYNDSGWTWSRYVGTAGKDGNDGDDGVSVTGIKEVYFLTTGSAPAQSTLPNGTEIISTSTASGQWTTAVPTYIVNGKYYTSIQTNLDKGISPIFSNIVLNQGLTDANKKAYDASIDASEAKELSRATQQHFWFNAEDIGSGANVIKSGAYITDTSIDSFKQNKSGGYLLARSDGLIFGKDTRTDAILNSDGLITSSGGIIAGNAGTNGYIYLSTHDYPLKDSSDSSHLVSGLTINGHTPTAQGTDGKLTSDPAWRQIIGTKFGVDSEGNLYANGANITGHISAESLTIASNAAIDPRIDNESVQVGGSNLLISKDFLRNQKLTLVESTGELIQEARQGYIISGPMEVQPSLPVIIQFWVNLEDAAETADLEVWFSGLCFYDSEDTYITGYSPETVTTYYEMRKVVAPSNASYCCFSFSVNAANIYWSNVWNNGNNGHNIKVELGSTPTTFALSQEDILNRIPTQVSELTNDENYASFDNFFDKVPHIDEEGISDGQTVITFESDNDILPISEVKVDINYTQSGSGDPSVDNIRPISGINHVTVYLSQGLSIDDESTRSYDIDFILPVERDGETVYELTTVYGGVLNVTAGVLEVNYLSIDSYNGEELPHLGNEKELPPVWVSDRDVYDPNGVPSIGAQVVYQIPTSIEYKVQAQQILMLIGTNNLWSSCDNISVSTITNIAEQDSTYRLVQDMIENFSRSNAAITSQSNEVNNLYNVNLETQKELSDLQEQVEENTRGITRIQDSVEVRVRTPEGEGETSLTVKSVETLEDESSVESSIKITPYQIILRSGENDMVSWLNATSFNTSQMVAADIRPWNMVIDDVTGEVVATGSVAIIGRKNGHVSIKRIQNT